MTSTILRPVSVGPARPTLRCLRDDLPDDWENPDQQRAIKQGRIPDGALSSVGHPVVRHAASMYSGDPDEVADRESISGLTNPAWWKVKTGRWRGAVWIDPESGQAWLVAAGTRREGSSDDFYSAFMRAIEARGPEAYLPTDEDRCRLRLEQASDQLRRWELLVFSAVTNGVNEAVSSGYCEVEILSLDDGPSPALLEIEVERVAGEWDAEGSEETPAGVAVHLVVRNWSDPDLLRRIQILACSAVSPCEQDWDAAPDAVGVRLMATISEARLRQIAASSQVDFDTDNETAQPGNIAPVTHAHYTAIPTIAAAAIDGHAIRGLCGVWFVPRQDHTALPVCPGCEEILHVRAKHKS